MTSDEDERKRHDALIAERIRVEALQAKKHKRRNAENNTDEAIRRRTDMDPFTGE